MNPASEEHRHTQSTLQVVCGFLLTEKVDIEQVIAKIYVQRDRIGHQEAIPGTEVHRELVVTGKRRRTKPRDDIKRSV